MSIGDFFKGLILDAWYKAFMYIGGIALLLSFFLDVKGLTNSQLQLIAGGVFLLGIGEWKNHKQDSWVKPPNVYTGPTALITRTAWKPDIIGLALDLIGIALLVIGVVSIIGQNQIGNLTPPTAAVTPTATLAVTPMLSPTITPSPTPTITPMLSPTTTPLPAPSVTPMPSPTIMPPSTETLTPSSAKSRGVV
jgi:hypothetical protein